MKGTLYSPALLCLVGLLLSFEYRGEKYRVLLRVFQALSVAVLVANATMWFISMPQGVVIAVNIAAVLANLPLAGLGMTRSKK